MTVPKWRRSRISYTMSLATTCSSCHCKSHCNLLVVFLWLCSPCFWYIFFHKSSVLGHIESGKGSIEKELKDQVKLYRWEQEPYSTASIVNFKKARQKIFKLLQRFNVRILITCLHRLFVRLTSAFAANSITAAVRTSAFSSRIMGTFVSMGQPL
jgi:hypothetical protein